MASSTRVTTSAGTCSRGRKCLDRALRIEARQVRLAAKYLCQPHKLWQNCVVTNNDMISLISPAHWGRDAIHRLNRRLWSASSSRSSDLLLLLPCRRAN
jgi:hypothetical protein